MSRTASVKAEMPDAVRKAWLLHIYLDNISEYWHKRGIFSDRYSEGALLGGTMKKIPTVTFTVLALLIFFASHTGADLQPVMGLHAFGGAERGNDRGINGPAGAIGGTEIFGLYPFTNAFGLQGSLLNQGGRGGYRLGVSAGPVFDYTSGKVGLFTDYIHQRRNYNHFFYLRGQWAHYFQNFDLVFSYSHPLNVEHTRSTVVDQRLVDMPDICGSDVLQTRTRRVRTRVPSMNELKTYARIYPTERTEVTLGLLVNSFAGPDRNETGTGVGGVFGASVQLLDWLVFRAVQGQMDTRERYRITSGLEFIWTPKKVDKPERLLGEEGKDATFALASAATGSFTSIPGPST